MILKKPKVFLLAETQMVCSDDVEKALKSIGGRVASRWLDAQVGRNLDGELLVEIAGRMCYSSYGVGINPNITQIREDPKAYYKNVLKQGDGSILEHGYCTFLLAHVSRVLTHELVRHRAGLAFSQESGRFNRIDETHPMRFWLPDLSEFDQYLKPHHRNGAQALKASTLAELAEEEEKAYLSFMNRYDWSAMDFNAKKKLTSAIRRILPNGMGNNIIFTANHRALRHMLTARTSEAAEIEIRMVFDEIGKTLKKRFPYIYQDFTRKRLPDGTGVWTPEYKKV